MKKHTIKKAFLILASAIMLFYSVFSVSVFAGGGPPPAPFNFITVRNLAMNDISFYYEYNFNLTYQDINSEGQFSVDVQTGVVYDIYAVDSNNYNYTLFYYNTNLSTDPNNPTEIYLDTTGMIDIVQDTVLTERHFYIIVYTGTIPAHTPTVAPIFTPSPTPTATPQVATPSPDPEATGIPFPTSTNIPQPSPLTSDTEFWERMGANANGAWGVITSTVSGIFSNVVMRNLVIYIPLFGLIVGLIIYTITLGGGDDN